MESFTDIQMFFQLLEKIGTGIFFDLPPCCIKIDCTRVTRAFLVWVPFGYIYPSVLPDGSGRCDVTSPFGYPFSFVLGMFLEYQVIPNDCFFHIFLFFYANIELSSLSAIIMLILFLDLTC